MKKKRRNKKRKELKQLGKLVSYGDFVLPPVIPGPKVKDLCKKIDNFYKGYPRQHRKQKASDLIHGAFYAVRPECKSNDDWMSQSANSLRDVLYPFFSEEVSKNNLLKLFRKYATDKQYRKKTQNLKFITTFNALYKIYKQLTDLAHHGTKLSGFTEEEYNNFSRNDFMNLINSFVSILREVLTLQQIYIHTVIDLIVQRKRKTKALKEDLELLSKVNPDACQYFFIKVDEQWLGWLWKNDFLDVIKQKAEDPTRYSYLTPELNYLVRMAEKVPAKVVNIMLEVEISKENFNPEVVDRFIQICSILPAEQLKKIVPKIRDEKWVSLMKGFNQWGFEYEKMFQKLAEAKDYESIIALAEAILSVKTKEEIEGYQIVFGDELFYFDDLFYTKVFEYLVAVNDKYAEKAFGLAIKVMGKLIGLLNKDSEEERVFKFYDRYILSDADFFNLGIEQRSRFSREGNIEGLVIAIIELAKRLIVGKCAQEREEVRRIFNQYIGDFDDINAPLPDSQAMWRLRLFFLSLCPQVFKEELKKSFFRLFEVESYYEIIQGVEYLEALRSGFYVLSDHNKRGYVNRVIEYFVKKEKEEEKSGHLDFGSKILSMIANHLTEEEKKKAEKIGFVINQDIKPEPEVKIGGVGHIFSQPPLSYESFQKIEVPIIAEKLRSEWSPKEIAEKYKERSDFFNRINAEGVGEYLQKNISERLQDYVDNAFRFFDRENLDSHYTYSYLRGIQETIKDNRELAAKVDWSGIINLFKLIKESGEKNQFEERKREREFSNFWLASWKTVHSAMADVLKELLSSKNDTEVINFEKYRNDIVSILKYLFLYPDPRLEDEKLETTDLKTKSSNDKDYMVSDPFSIAINSVRGRVFEAFLLFVYQDSKRFKEKDKVKIADDVKSLYENVLEKENTRAIMFLFGYHLPSFYYRDKLWIKRLLKVILPGEKSKKHLYTAAWEGYLSQNLYKEIFFDSDFQKLYGRGVDLTDDDFPPYQKHFKDPENAIGIHLALAFIYFPEFGFEHNLFKKFWKTKRPKSHKEFISFIGNSCLSNEVAGDEWFEKNKIDKGKLIELWNWALKNVSDPKILSGFGSWINPNREILDDNFVVEKIALTIQKTGGYIDWDYGLFMRLPFFAEKNKGKTLEIISNYFLNSKGKLNQNFRKFQLYEEEIKRAMIIIYKNGDEKIREKVKILIDTLIREGSNIFWGLKEVIGD